MLNLLCKPRKLARQPGAAKLRWAWALALGLCLLGPAGWAASFTASLDRDSITLGENATLALTVAGEQPANVPVPPTVPNLQIAYLRSSSQVTIVNGQVNSTITYNFQLSARQPGDYTIPAMTVEVGGEKLSSQPVLLKVLKPNAPSADAINSGAQLAFLKLQVPQKEVYVGQTFAVRLELYLGNKIQRVDQIQPTGFQAEGFAVGSISWLADQQRKVQMGNAVYTLVPGTAVVRVVKTGALTLGPVTANLLIEVPSTNRRQDPFEQMMRDPFGMGLSERRQLPVATEAVSLQVLNLPHENMPADFNGAVGNYSLSMSAGPTNLAAGDPITVKVQISGRGWLDGLALPEQTAWKDFKTYPPTSKVQATDSLGLQGTKTFEQIVVPQNADIKALPGLTFSFFDPDQKVYRTLAQPAVPLVVRPTGAAPTPTYLAADRNPSDAPAPKQDILPNKQRLGTLSAVTPPLAEQGWFMALQGVPVLAFISTIVWRRRSDSLANNPRLRRQRQVAQMVRDGLAELRQLAAANDSEKFFALVFRLLQEQLGERLDLPASAITEAVVEERLRPRGLPDTVLTPLQELFQTCNQARYAPIKSSQALAAMVPKVEAVLQQLQEVKL